ncbi:glycosyltransferase family 2 protein [Rhizobium sp. BK376]|uniref:glycosyltransferase family 2 protein n=1 Tax=Rhizobium sp. BK376 TaxID=2512149 RepID=UPI00104E69B7|nr:glycosyltransferase family 2 protein [Rhizobium sp. BK376]TCR71386.1 glycosyltransferase involved in cell wall biosynthesis [Rhizobium sp. BK376]
MPLLSVISPFLNERDTAEAFARFVKSMSLDVRQRFGLNVEVVLVDDGSTDGSIARYRQVLEGDWRIVELSRNFGKEIALVSGVEESRGDYVLMIDADLQHPYEVCIDIINTLLADPDLDVVYSIRADRLQESWSRAFGAKLFYRLINGGQRFVIPENAGDFRVMRREAANALLTIRDKRRFNKGLYAWMGFRQKGILYTPDPRAAGKTKWSKLALAALSLEGITSFSAVPLRIMSAIGVIIGCAGMVYGSELIIKVLLFGTDVPGYPSLMASISVLGGFNLALLGLLGEYIWVTIAEVKDRPLYIVRRIHRSGPIQ